MEKRSDKNLSRIREVNVMLNSGLSVAEALASANSAYEYWSKKRWGTANPSGLVLMAYAKASSVAKNAEMWSFWESLVTADPGTNSKEKSC